MVTGIASARLLQIDATYLDRPGPPTIMLWEEQPQTRKQITPIQRTHVQYVRFNGAVSDGAIESLVQLPALRQVHFVRVTITPKQLESLSHLSSVDEVAFLVCDLPEVSRRELPRLSHLRSFIWLAAAPDALFDVTSLTPLRNLQELRLSGITVTLQDLCELPFVSAIRSLDLCGSRLLGPTDPMNRFSSLRCLRVTSTNLTWNDMAFVVSLQSLTELSGPPSQIGDGDIALLASCHSLRSVDLGYPLTESQLIEIRNRLPQVSIAAFVE